MKEKLREALDHVASGLNSWGSNYALGYISLAACLTKVLWGVWRAWDLPLWDGSTYFIYARSIVESLVFPPFQWSPLFAAYYAFFHATLSCIGPYGVYLAHRIATVALIVFLCYTVARLLSSPLIAWCLSMYVMLISVILLNHYVVHSFVLVPLFLTCLGLGVRTGLREGLLLAGLLLTSFVRAEFLLAFGIALVLMVWREVSNGWESGRRLKAALPHLLIPSLALVALLCPLILRAGPSHSAIERTWGAFVQHYAWGYQERHPEWTGDPWYKWQEPIRMSFGNATTLTEAFIANPHAILEHVLWNLHLFPGELAMTFATMPPWHLLALLPAFGIALCAILPFAARRHGAGEPRDTKCRPTPASSLAVVLFSSFIATATSALLIRPRPEYLIALLPMIIVGAGLGFEGFRRTLPRAPRLDWVVPLAFLPAILLLPSPFQASTSRPVLETVQVLKSLDVSGSYGLLAESSRAFCAYSTPDRCVGVEAYEIDPNEPDFKGLLERRDIRVIVLNERLVENLPQSGQEFLRRLVSSPGANGWVMRDAGAGFRILARAGQ